MNKLICLLALLSLVACENSVHGNKGGINVPLPKTIEIGVFEKMEAIISGYPTLGEGVEFDEYKFSYITIPFEQLTLKENLCFKNNGLVIRLSNLDTTEEVCHIGSLDYLPELNRQLINQFHIVEISDSEISLKAFIPLIAGGEIGDGRLLEASSKTGLEVKSSNNCKVYDQEYTYNLQGCIFESAELASKLQQSPYFSVANDSVANIMSYYKQTLVSPDFFQ